MNEELKQAPVRLCCGERHYGAQCSDGLVLCQICYYRFTIEDLLHDADGSPVDICKGCAIVSEGGDAVD